MQFFGTLLIIFAISWLLKTSIKNKTIFIFGLTEKENTLYFHNNGQFSISTVKGRFVEVKSGFNVLITQNFKNSAPLSLHNLKFGIRTFINFHVGKEFVKFTISDPGSYKIEVENPEMLIVKEPRFGVKRVNDRIETCEIELAVIKFYPFWHRLVSISMILIGFLIIFFKHKPAA